VIKNPTNDRNYTQYGDTANLDAFSRLRVSNPVSLFVSSLTYSLQDTQWETIINGTGASVTHSPNEALAVLQAGTVSGEYAIRQTYRYFTYVPGKSQLVAMTGILGSGKTNVTSRLGYYDDRNGLFFQLTDTTLSVVKRSYTSGAAVDTSVSQSGWNIDKLDGQVRQELLLI